jgi:hypothetical protein
MNATTAGHDRKKIPLRWVIVLGICLFLIVEPLIMYRSLVNQRDQRQAARELMMQASAGEPGK